MPKIDVQTLIKESRTYHFGAPGAEQAWKGFIQRCVAYMREYHEKHMDDFRKAATQSEFSKTTAPVSEYLRTLGDIEDNRREKPQLRPHRG